MTKFFGSGEDWCRTLKGHSVSYGVEENTFYGDTLAMYMECMCQHISFLQSSGVARAGKFSEMKHWTSWVANYFFCLVIFVHYRCRPPELKVVLYICFHNFKLQSFNSFVGSSSYMCCSA